VKVLLDTCTFLWLAIDSPELPGEVGNIILDPDNEVFLSVVSTWEIAVKNALGRLPLPRPVGIYLPELREKLGVDSLELDEESTLHIVKLPDLHRDPFDRMLVCQAFVHGMTLLTPDRAITQYPVRSVW
jgi:PIN domain nuclease of toxin-antitoxin system